MVELLIVIVVVGVLTAISIVAYSGISNSAYDSTVRQDLASVRKGLEMARAELGHYPAGANDFPEGLKISRGSYSTAINHVNYIVDVAAENYALGVMSKSWQGFILTNSELIETSTPWAANTAQAIGITWGAGGYYIQGYLTSREGGWHPNWRLVQP